MYPRFATARLLEALEDSPVVLVHGPRQSGKTTLARKVGDAQGFTYLSLDDQAVLHAAASDPLAFVAQQLGHTDIRMVSKHYGHLAPNALADAVRGLAPKLGLGGASKVATLKVAGAVK